MGEAQHRVPVAALPALAAIAWLCFASQIFNDGDTAWHLATGRWIAANGTVPHVDPFSFTHRGMPWTAHEWLADLAMSGTLASAGWAGFAFLFALAVGCTMWICAKALPLPTRYSVLLQVALLGTLAPFALARPHVLACRSSPSGLPCWSTPAIGKERRRLLQACSCFHGPIFTPATSWDSLWRDCWPWKHLSKRATSQARCGDGCRSVRDAVKSHAIAWTILLPETRLARSLDREPGWRRVFADRFAVIHVRSKPLTKPGVQ